MSFLCTLQLILMFLNHCHQRKQLTFFSFFTTVSAVLTLAICVLYQVDFTHPLLITVLPDTTAMLLILIGIVISLAGLVSATDIFATEHLGMLVYRNLSFNMWLQML